jgi:hypothetical protein
MAQQTLRVLLSPKKIRDPSKPYNFVKRFVKRYEES